MIGRKSEIEKLERAFESDESEFVAVYGRRRVGKTFLVRETFNDRFAFYHTGIAGKGGSFQLREFRKSLQGYGLNKAKTLRNWFEAFDELKRLLVNRPSGKKVVFIDEMPWLDTQRTDFISALEVFWNGWAVARKDILLIVCGSAASWIVKNLFRNRGGLHNRVTQRISLQPMSLRECEMLAESRGVGMSRMDIAEAYMILGGIPYYWRYLDRKYSLAQNIDMMFFEEGAPLRYEFDDLYSSLFGRSDIYKAIVKALSGKKAGMTRGEIAVALGKSGSGMLSNALAVLEQCGFLRVYNEPQNRKRCSIYQLIDGFTLFHFRFLERSGQFDPHFWMTMSLSPSLSAWRGIAFERLCLLHREQLRSALGISGVHVEAYGWSHRPDENCPEGAQIDLILQRVDHVVNVCEMKFTREPFVITKNYYSDLQRKIAVFKATAKIDGAVHLTMISASGILRNEYRNGIQSEVTLDDLFAF